jgi:hypothetical protein
VTIRRSFPPFQAREFTMETWDSPEDFRTISAKHDANVKRETYNQDFPGGAHGFIWEQDSVARHIRDGKIENERCREFAWCSCTSAHSC